MMSRRPEEFLHIGDVEFDQRLWRRRVEPVSAIRPEQVSRLCICAFTLARKQYLRDVRRTEPVHQPTAIEPSRAIGGGYRRSHAQHLNPAEGPAEHRDGLRHSDHGGIVGPHSAVDEPNVLAGQ